MKAASFRELRIWQEGFALAIETHVLTRKFPKEELFGITAQIRRSANSITANIAEGSGRHSTKEYEHFLWIARGSLKETISHLLLSRALGYAEPQAADGILSRYQGLDAGISACLKSLRHKSARALPLSPSSPLPLDT